MAQNAKPHSRENRREESSISELMLTTTELRELLALCEQAEHAAMARAEAAEKAHLWLEGTPQISLALDYRLLQGKINEVLIARGEKAALNQLH